MTSRPDLAALTDDALALVSNWGLVKRAVRLSAADGPEISESERHIVARYSDGVVTDLPTGEPFTAALCTCGATSVCRHRIGLVVAYRTLHKPDLSDVRWTPGDFSDEALTRHLGSTVMKRAERIRSEGYQASVHRTPQVDLAVRVELAHCTVRFLVPHELSHSHSSASTHMTDESIALAVWAVRKADESSSVDVYVGPPTVLKDSARLEEVRMLARTILLDGIAGTTAVQRAAAVRVTRRAEAGSMVWLTDACAEMTDQIEAYAMRHSRHSRIRTAKTIAEIHARADLGMSPDGVLAGAALGTETSGETPLRRSRLISLGAHVRGNTDELTTDIYFAEVNSDAIFLLSHGWPGESLTGHAVSQRKIAGTTVAALATSTVVTESAVRRANRRIRLGNRGIGKTSVLPLGADAWASSTNVSLDYAETHRRLRERKPSFARERVVTGGVGILRVDSVISTDYAPSEQLSTILVSDGVGNQAQITVEHRANAPGAIDAVIRAMSAGPRAVTGRMSVRAGMLTITPFAVACDLGIVVPDLAPGDGAELLARTITTAKPDSIESALTNTIAVLADLAHSGLRHISESSTTALRHSIRHLTVVGMESSAKAVDKVVDRIDVDGDADLLADAWIHAVTRLIVASESR